MSNPCINSWGLNKFWHHYWYSDSSYAQNLQQDKLTLELIQTYLCYGSDFSTNVFQNEYWYNTNQNQKNHTVVLRDYYSWLTIHNETLRSINTYRLRLDSVEMFQTRVNVMRFGSWLVVNLYWFQPDKTNNNREASIKPYNYTNSATNLSRSYSSIIKFRALVNHTNLQTTKPSASYLF